MDNLDFLKDSPMGDATLSVSCTDGTVVHINDLDLESIRCASPLLALAFESTRTGPKHYMENVTLTAVASLLRFIYSSSKDYVPDDCKNLPISLLVHAHVYHLADIYDIEDLRSLAKANVTRGCEFSCSACMPPLDLCEAIDFVYSSLPDQKDIIDILANYCVSMFLYHKLGQIQSFRDLAYEHRRLQQDLCMVNIKRGFVDDAALAIIQLPIKPFGSGRNDRFEGSILRDVLYDLWSVTDDAEGQIGNMSDPMYNISGNHSPEDASQRDQLSWTTPRTLPYRCHDPRDRTQIDLSTRKAIAEVFTNGILSLPGEHTVKSHPDTESRLEKESRAFTAQDTRAERNVGHASLISRADISEEQGVGRASALASDTPENSSYNKDKRTAGPILSPPPSRCNLEHENFLPSHKRPAQIDEVLDVTSDNEDGYVHLHVDPDAEWTIV